MAVRVVDRASLAKGTSVATGQRVELQLGKPTRLVRLTGMFFDTSKCFLLPSAMEGIRGVRRVYDEHPVSNLLVVGHTDTSGQDAYNSTLSLERADSIAAFLKDDVSAWDAFFAQTKPDEKRWGLREIQLMLMAVSGPNGPFFTGEASGRNDAATEDAVRSFQSQNELEVDGIAGPNTRKVLIKQYMATDGTTLPEQNPVTGTGITLTTHGCGENFPASSEASDTGAPSTKAQDGVHNADDRRVELFFFDGPITPPPPGKTSSRGSSEYPAWRKQVTETIDLTVAEISPEAPCHISFLLHSDLDGSPLANVLFQIEITPGTLTSGVSDGSGAIQIDGVEPGDFRLVVAGVEMRVPALDKRESKRPIRIRADRAEV